MIYFWVFGLLQGPLLSMHSYGASVHDGELYCHSNSADIQTTVRIKSTVASSGMETIKIFLNERDYKGMLDGLRNSPHLSSKIKNNLSKGEWIGIEIPDAEKKCARSKEDLLTISCTQTIDGLSGLRLTVHKSATQPAVVEIPVVYRGFVFSISHVTQKEASFLGPYDSTTKQYKLMFFTQILTEDGKYGQGSTNRAFDKTDCVFVPN